MKKLLFIILAVIFGTVNGQDDFSKAGRTSFQFLKIGVGARAAGLGEALIADAKDVNSVYWNPAAITGIDRMQVGAEYVQWFADLNLFSGAFGYSVPGVGTFVVHALSLDYGDIEEALTTSTTGHVDTRTGNYFSGSDMAIGIAGARKFTDKLSIGVNFKYLREDLYTYSDDLWAFDVGSYYDTGWKGIRIGMSAQNFSGSARWLNTREEEQQTYQLPLLFRIGFSMDLMGGQDLVFGGDPRNQKLTFNADAVHSNDYKERLNLGVEYGFMNMLFLRGGYRINYDEGNFGAGIGLNYNTGGINFRLDYAYVDYDFLDVTHRFGVVITY